MRSIPFDSWLRLKHKLRHYDLPIITEKAVLEIGLRLLSAPCDDSQDCGKLATKAIRDLKAGGKLTHNRPFAIQELQTILSCSNL